MSKITLAITLAFFAFTSLQAQETISDESKPSTEMNASDSTMSDDKKKSKKEKKEKKAKKKKQKQSEESMEMMTSDSTSMADAKKKSKKEKEKKEKEVKEKTPKVKDPNAPQGYNALGAKVLFIDHGWPNSASGLSITNGLEVHYKRNFNKLLNLVVPLKIGVADVPGEVNNRNLTIVDAILQFQYDKGDNKFIPYALAGGGIALENTDESNFQIPIGAGVNYQIGRNSFINLQWEFPKLRIFRGR